MVFLVLVFDVEVGIPFGVAYAAAVRVGGLSVFFGYVVGVVGIAESSVGFKRQTVEAVERLRVVAAQAAVPVSVYVARRVGGKARQPVILHGLGDGMTDDSPFSEDVYTSLAFLKIPA